MRECGKDLLSGTMRGNRALGLLGSLGWVLGGCQNLT